MVKTRKASAKLSQLDLIAGAIGMLPIPIVGEALAGRFFYKVMEEMPILAESKTHRVISSIALTGLTKIGLYNNFPGYQAAYDFMLNSVLK